MEPIINYTEPHHLVPLSVSHDFPDIDLDREQNIVSIYSNCHNLLYHGVDYKKLLYTLFLQRRKMLELIGIKISFEQLLNPLIWEYFLIIEKRCVTLLVATTVYRRYTAMQGLL